MWHHNQVLKCLAAAIEDRRREANSQAAVGVIRQIHFVGDEEKARSTNTRHLLGQLRAGGAWETRAIIKQKLVVCLPTSLYAQICYCGPIWRR